MSLRSVLMIASAVTFLALGAVTATAQDGRPVAPPNAIPFGVYDPAGDFQNDTLPSIEHLFLPWEDIDLATLGLADNYARARNRTVLITVEPWSWDQDKRVSSANLLAGIQSGAYDGNIIAICTEIGKMQAATTLRWAQEMEDDTGRFTWANWTPSDYIAAYRHVVELCRPLTPKTRYMWSPKGMPTLVDYYPGDDVVDDIGLSVFGLQAFDNGEFGRDRTFAEILKPGYDLVLPFNKPIYVAEAGYVGKAPYVTQWKTTILANDPAFPELRAVIYFNDKEVAPWPKDYGLPNWKVTDNTLP
ncbi:MAG: beta-mannosidase [Hyphomicrobiales bacterium]|nr:MAG: beta-mannosidase [Hyphomicrobiales bacterium]